MKKILSLLITVFLTAGLLSCSDVCSFAFNNFYSPEDGKLYPVLNDSSESNSSLQNAFLKVKYDLKSNRIYMHFIFTFLPFESDEKIAIRTAFNDIGEITVFSDGTNEYNSDIFYVENDMFSDGRTGTVDFTVITGIKDGIPENLIVSVIFRDPEGILSNTYRVDISPEEYVSPAIVTESKASDEVNTAKEKTSKVKRTKAKTTKKHKAKKSAKQRSEKTSYEKETYNASIRDNSGQNIIKDRQKKRTTVLFICASAILGTAIGCTVGIKQIHKKD